MSKKKQGLIVNVSSFGGKMYLFNPIYGVGKAGCDRMAQDCAKELKVLLTSDCVGRNLSLRR